MMRFLRWFSRVSPSPKPVSKIQELVSLYRTFKPESLSDVFSSDKSIYRVVVIEKKITAYRALLAECINMMHQDDMIPVHYVGKDPEEVLKREFFTSEKGNFVDPVKEAAEFVNHVIMFLELYEQLEESQEKSFNTQKNIYTVQKIAANLMTLIREL